MKTPWDGVRDSGGSGFGKEELDAAWTYRENMIHGSDQA